MMINKSQQGLSLYLSFIIMTILLAIALGISTIFIGQARMIKEMGNSVIAFYAADSGIEEVLMGDRANPASLCTGVAPCVLGNGSEYYIDIIDDTDPNCSADNFCIKSIGSYKKIRRAIEINY